MAYQRNSPLYAIRHHLFYLTFFLTYVCITSFTVGIAILALRLFPPISTMVIVLAVLTPLVLVSSIYLYKYVDSWTDRSMYIVSTIIFGFFFYWFLTSILFSLVLSYSYFYPISHLFTISICAYAAATLLAIIGIFQSFVIKIVRYKIPAPEVYKMLIGKKIVMLADLHLGPVNQEIFARKVFKKVIAEQPDLVLIPGDMFDSEVYDDVVSLQKEMKMLTATIPVYYSPGNHEHYGPFNHFLEIAEGGGIIVLVDEAIHFHGVPILGLDWRQKKNIDEIEHILSSSIHSDEPAIVLNHEPILHDMLEKAGAFLVVSGHTHKGQFWPVQYLVYPFYKKFTYGMQQYGKLTSITTSGVGTWGMPMRTFNTPEIVTIEFV